MSAEDETTLRPLPSQGQMCEIGEFQLLDRLGKGAMGEVFVARQKTLDRTVALKLLSAEFAKNKNFVDRFWREARVAASLNHPNIVHLHTAGQKNDIPYYAMELVEGETLRQRLDRLGKIPPREALGYIAQAARGLAYAWNLNQIVHRDIKPDNLILARDGTLKIADLGLAKPLAEDGSITVGQWQLGTPHYISPEQAAGRDDLDFRSDIYSLGATLYHLVTGRVPFEGGTAAVIMTKHLNEPLPDPRQQEPKLNPRITEIIRRMMAKDPKNRYASYEQLLADLEPFVAPPETEQKSRLVFCLLAFGVGWLGVHRLYLRYRTSGLILMAIGLTGATLNVLDGPLPPTQPTLGRGIGGLALAWAWLDLLRGLLGGFPRDARGLPLKRLREGF